MNTAISKINAVLSQQRALFWGLALIAYEWPFVLHIVTGNTYWNSFVDLPSIFDELSARAVAATFMLGSGLILLSRIADSLALKIRYDLASLGKVFLCSLVVQLLSVQVFAFLYNWIRDSGIVYLFSSCLLLLCLQLKFPEQNQPIEKEKDTGPKTWRVLVATMLLISGWMVAPLTREEHQEKFDRRIDVFCERPSDETFQLILDEFDAASRDNVRLFAGPDRLTLVRSISPKSIHCHRR